MSKTESFLHSLVALVDVKWDQSLEKWKKKMILINSLVLLEM